MRRRDRLLPTPRAQTAPDRVFWLWPAAVVALLSAIGCASPIRTGDSARAPDSGAGAMVAACSFDDDASLRPLDDGAVCLSGCADAPSVLLEDRAAPRRVFNQIPVRLDAVGPADVFPTGMLLQEGDILLGRAYGLVSAAISGHGATPGPFSHAAMYYRDADGVGRVINFRPRGLETCRPEEYFARYNRLAIVRPVQPPDDLHGFSREARAWLERDRRRRIPPDFLLDDDNPSSLYCLKLVSLIYRANNLPDPFAEKTDAASDTVLAASRAIFGVPIESVSNPNSVLARPDFTAVAEWLRPEYNLDFEAINEALADRIFAYVSAGYEPREPGFGTRLKVNFSLAARAVANAFTFWRDHTPLPPYVDRRDIGRGLVMYAHVDNTKRLAARDLGIDLRRANANALPRDGQPASAGDQRIREMTRAASDRFRDRYYKTPNGYTPELPPATAVLPNRRAQYRNRLPRFDPAAPHRPLDALAAAPAYASAIAAAPLPATPPAATKPAAVEPINADEPFVGGIVYWRVPIDDPASQAQIEPAASFVDVAANPPSPAPGAPRTAATTPESTPSAATASVPPPPAPGEPFIGGFTYHSVPVDEAPPSTAAGAPRTAASDTEIPLLIAAVRRARALAPPDANRSADMDDMITPEALADAMDDREAADAPGLPSMAVLVAGDTSMRLPPSPARIDPPTLLTRRHAAGTPPAQPRDDADPAERPNPFLTPEENAGLAAAPLRADELPALPANGETVDVFSDAYGASPIPDHAAMMPRAYPAPAASETSESLMPMAAPAGKLKETPAYGYGDDDEPDAPIALPPPPAADKAFAMRMALLDLQPADFLTAR